MIFKRNIDRKKKMNDHMAYDVKGNNAFRFISILEQKQMVLFGGDSFFRSYVKCDH